jgi:hypothetical protein
MPIFCNKIGEPDSTKAMKCSKVPHHKFYPNLLSHNKTSAKCEGKYRGGHRKGICHTHPFDWMDGWPLVKPFLKSTLNRIMAQCHPCGKTKHIVTLQSKHINTYTSPSTHEFCIPKKFMKYMYFERVWSLNHIEPNLHPYMVRQAHSVQYTTSFGDHIQQEHVF